MSNDPGAGASALAAEPIDDYDIALLRSVAAAYATADPVPDGLVERLQFAITLDDLQAEIAQLERNVDLVGSRGSEAADVQTITFTSQSLTTMVTITPSGADRVRIDGWAASGGGVSIELRTVGGRLETRADSDGRFVFDDVPRGLAQFVLRHPPSSSLPPVVTPSIEL